MLATSRATRVKTSSGRAPRATSRATLTSAAWASTTRSRVSTPPSPAATGGASTMAIHRARRPGRAGTSATTHRMGARPPDVPTMSMSNSPSAISPVSQPRSDHHSWGGPAPRISSRERPVSSMRRALTSSTRPAPSSTAAAPAISSRNTRDSASAAPEAVTAPIR